jgi:hypothetical protein
MLSLKGHAYKQRCLQRLYSEDEDDVEEGEAYSRPKPKVYNMQVVRSAPD